MSSIGLWMDGEKVVGAAIYDMYFGEAFVGVLPEYNALYPEILGYAYRELKDENGLGIAVCNDCIDEIGTAKLAGFEIAEQTETVMRLDLDKELKPFAIFHQLEYLAQGGNAFFGERGLEFVVFAPQIVFLELGERERFDVTGTGGGARNIAVVHHDHFPVLAQIHVGFYDIRAVFVSDTVA